MKWALPARRPAVCCSSIADGWSRPARRTSSLPGRKPNGRGSSCSAMPARRLCPDNEGKTVRTAMHPIFHLLPDAPKPVAPYSHAVEAGSFVFVTGQLATDPDDDSLPVPPGIEAQTHKVMDNLSRVLKGCGLSLA